MNKVGIFAGTFDPIHNGHLTFAKAALDEVSLDKVYFLIEKSPRNKQNVTDPVQRQAMVELAISDVPNIELLELPSKQFDVSETLPQLKEKFENAELYLLMGHDIFENLPTWPGFDELVNNVKFIVAKRQGGTVASHDMSYHVLKTPLPTISSSKVRNGNFKTEDIPRKVGKYIETQKLYYSVLSSGKSSSGTSK